MRIAIFSILMMAAPLSIQAQSYPDQPVPAYLNVMKVGPTALDFFRASKNEGMSYSASTSIEGDDATPVGTKHDFSFRLMSANLAVMTAFDPDFGPAEVPADRWPSYMVDYEGPFQSRIFDENEIFQNALPAFGEQWNCERRENVVEYHFDENWQPHTSQCNIDTLVYGKPMPEAMIRNILDGDVWRYTVVVGIFKTTSKDRDKFLAVSIQDNLMRAAVESVALNLNIPAGQAFYDSIAPSRENLPAGTQTQKWN